MWNRVINFFITNITITNVFMITLLCLGIICGIRLKRDISPYVESNSVFVRIYSPGSTAQEIEQDIIRPLETEIQKLENKPEYTSFANNKFGQIRAVFTGEPNINTLKEMKRDFIDQLRNSSDFGKNVKITFSEDGAQSIPMYYFALYKTESSLLSQIEFQKFGAEIAKKNADIPGVAYTEASGLLKEEIHIDVDPQKMKEKYVSLYEIAKAIQTRNIRSSGGEIDLDNKSKVIIIDGGYPNPIDVQDTIIRSSFENQRVRVKDVATVTETLQDNSVDVEINDGEGIFFGVVMKSDEDIHKVTRSIDEAIKSYQDILPKGIKLVVIEKRFESVKTILDIVQSSAIIGIIIVFLILVFFLDWRTAFWTTSSIPMTISALMIYMYFNDMSINIISLCAIITVLGMLVDHGIVIAENIHHYRSKGLNPLHAVYKGVKEVFVPILITVITTIAAFMPLTILSDTIGGLIKPLPIIVSIALIFSFIDALLFLPAHLAHIPEKTLSKNSQEKKWLLDLKEKYGNLLKKILKQRYFILMLFIGILIGTVFLTKKMFKEFIFMEPIGIGSLYVNMETKGGTSFEYMQSIVKDVKTIIKENLHPSEYTAIKAETGRFDILSLWSKGIQPNRGQVAIYLKPNAHHGRTYKHILAHLKEELTKHPISTNFTRLFFESHGLIPKGKSAIAVQFLQENPSDNDSYISAMLQTYKYIETLPGIANLVHTTIKGKDQLLVVFDYEKIAQLGINVQTVSETIKIAIGGLTVSQWKSNDKEVSYLIRLDPKQKNSIKTINELLVPNQYYRLIKLQEFARLENHPGIPDIHRICGKPMTEILVDIDPNITTSSQIAKQIIKYYKTIDHNYSNVRLKLDGEASDINESFADFKIAFIIALLLIYIVLLGLFRSLIQPFIVLIAIPFGMIGAIWAFYFHNQVLSFMSVVGIIGLMGVVVNDAIVMVEFINNMVRSSSQKMIIESIVLGAKQRFKAVLLTTITTVAGLLPSIYGLQGVADLIVPITTAMAYGLIFATALTLILIPVIYLISIDISTLFNQKILKKEISS